MGISKSVQLCLIQLVPTCFIYWRWLNVEAKVKTTMRLQLQLQLQLWIRIRIQNQIRLRLRLCPSELSVLWAQWKCHPAVFQLLGPMHSRLPRLCDWAMYLLAARCLARYWNGLWFLVTHKGVEEGAGGILSECMGCIHRTETSTETA